MQILRSMCVWTPRCTIPESELTQWRFDPSVGVRRSSVSTWLDQQVRLLLLSLVSLLISLLFFKNYILKNHSFRSMCFPGKCFHLYPEDEQLPAENSPQILESNITPTVLFLKRIEIAGLAQCDFIDRPGKPASSNSKIQHITSSPLISSLVPTDAISLSLSLSCPKNTAG